MGHGCGLCAKNKNYTTEEFIRRAKEVHGDKYDYSKSVYVNYITKVEIICPKHGSFWQQPSCHINGYNCPHCQQSKMEMEMEKMLRENNINFIIQKRFTWLNRLSLDFYLPEHNIAIECQGQQHFISIEFFDTKDDDFQKRINRDIDKFNKLKENNIKILYLLPNNSTDYTIINQIQEIYTKDNTFINGDDIINYIKKEGL
jgi:very-short-patch-repair endonuclease